VTNGIRKPHLPDGCCIPFIRQYPSGRAWTHARCDKADQKFTREESLALRDHNIEHMKSKEAQKRHPSTAVHEACKAAYASGGQTCSRCAPKLHPAECDCPFCRYTDAHSDDELEVFK
jgi:hypothetical protein